MCKELHISPKLLYTILTMRHYCSVPVDKPNGVTILHYGTKSPEVDQLGFFDCICAIIIGN